jgi:hypothetical protein
MMEYIIIAIAAIILILNDYFDFLSKGILGAVLGILLFALLHIIIKDAVVAAIKKTKE